MTPMMCIARPLIGHMGVFFVSAAPLLSAWEPTQRVISRNLSCISFVSIPGRSHK